MSVGDVDLAAAWRAFVAFAAEPVRCADDTTYVWIGPDPRGGPGVVARFGRRFEVNDDDKNYDRTEAVALRFDAEPGVTLDAPSLSLSTVGFRTLAPFVAAVEDAPAFRAAMAHRPWRCVVEAWSTREP
jgi:hypothetical protein